MNYPKLLVHHGKHGDTSVVVNSSKEEEQGWLALFRSIDLWCQYYTQFGMEGDEQHFYDLAKLGDARAARCLLQMRDMHEYESVSIESVYTPDELFEILDRE